MNAADRVLVGLGGLVVILGAGPYHFFLMPESFGDRTMAIVPAVVIYGIGIALLGASRLLSGIRSIFTRA